MQGQDEVARTGYNKRSWLMSSSGRDIVGPGYARVTREALKAPVVRREWV
jgi:hypothetical protein